MQYSKTAQPITESNMENKNKTKQQPWENS